MRSSAKAPTCTPRVAGLLICSSRNCQPVVSRPHERAAVEREQLQPEGGRSVVVGDHWCVDQRMLGSVKSILISGIGVAGPTLAFWLKAAGFEPTLIERAAEPRTGGYVIDFWGLGYDIAERMGLESDINHIGYRVRELRIVDDRGERVTGFGIKIFDELTGGRYVTLARSDLSRLLFEKVKGTTEIDFRR